MLLKIHPLSILPEPDDERGLIYQLQKLGHHEWTDDVPQSTITGVTWNPVTNRQCCGVLCGLRRNEKLHQAQ